MRVGKRFCTLCGIESRAKERVELLLRKGGDRRPREEKRRKGESWAKSIDKYDQWIPSKPFPYTSNRGRRGKHNRGSGETGALADDGSFPD